MINVHVDFQGTNSWFVNERNNGTDTHWAASKLPHKEIHTASPNEFKQNCHTMKANKSQLRNEIK